MKYLLLFFFPDFSYAPIYSSIGMLQNYYDSFYYIYIDKHYNKFQIYIILGKCIQVKFRQQKWLVKLCQIILILAFTFIKLVQIKLIIFFLIKSSPYIIIIISQILYSILWVQDHSDFKGSRTFGLQFDDWSSFDGLKKYLQKTGVDPKKIMDKIQKLYYPNVNKTIDFTRGITGFLCSPADPVLFAEIFCAKFQEAMYIYLYEKSFDKKNFPPYPPNPVSSNTSFLSLYSSYNQDTKRKLLYHALIEPRSNMFEVFLKIKTQEAINQRYEWYLDNKGKITYVKSTKTYYIMGESFERDYLINLIEGQYDIINKKNINNNNNNKT